MNSIRYQIEILQNQSGTLTKLAEVKTPLALDKAGTILQFSKNLSDPGTCTFRVSAFDTMLTQYGDVFIPHQYHVRIRRNGQVVWRGAIIDNNRRTKDYWEIVCAEYLWYLNRLLIQRSSTNPITGQSDGIYRIFNSGTMAAAVTAMMNETIAKVSTGTNKQHVLSAMTLGVVENPNFPPNMTDATGAALTGAWTFSTNLSLQYDFQSVYYVLKSFGIYSYADFYIDENLVFNFKKFVGNDRHYDVNFTFNKSGDFAQSNIVDYSLPRQGGRMANVLWGVATDTTGKVLFKQQSDQPSITAYGYMEAVAAYSDVKDQGVLNARTQAELPLISTPTPNTVTVVLNETAAYPLGLWDVGDIVNLNIQNNGLDFTDSRRIVGASVRLHDTGRELTTVQTNTVQPWQYGSITS